MSPSVSQLVAEGIVEPKTATQLDAMKAGMLFARTEGMISAPETNHALACIIDEAQKAKEEGKEKVILANWSGHGLIDLVAYDKYFAGELHNFALSDEELSASQKVFEDFPKPELVKSR
jgi:tryptophan synthase beta chain